MQCPGRQGTHHPCLSIDPNGPNYFLVPLRRSITQLTVTGGPLVCLRPRSGRGTPASLRSQSRASSARRVTSREEVSGRAKFGTGDDGGGRQTCVRRGWTPTRARVPDDALPSIGPVDSHWGRVSRGGSFPPSSSLVWDVNQRTSGAVVGPRPDLSVGDGGTTPTSLSSWRGRVPRPGVGPHIPVP